ncbi:putative membrane protein, partial [Yersinia pestis PY-14]
MLLLLISVLA